MGGAHLNASLIRSLLAIQLSFASVLSMQHATAAGFDTAPRLGEFDHMVMGAFNPLPEDTAVTKTYWGMPHTDTWPALLLRDDAGNYYMAMNWVASTSGGALQAGPWGGPAKKSSPEGFVTDTRVKPWSGAATQALTPDKKLQFQAAGQQITFDQKSVEWKSDDIQLKGELATPGMSFLLPWREPDGKTDAMYYTAQYYKVEG